MAVRSTPWSSAQRSRGAAMGRVRVGSWAFQACMPGSLDEHMFEQQWDEAGEHPGHDVLSHDLWRWAGGSAGLLADNRNSGPLAARQRCWLVVATSRPNPRSPHRKG